jgi:hypothetical protein
MHSKAYALYGIIFFNFNNQAGYFTLPDIKYLRLPPKQSHHILHNLCL